MSITRILSRATQEMPSKRIPGESYRNSSITPSCRRGDWTTRGRHGESHFCPSSPNSRWHLGTKELANQCQQITAHAVGMYTVQIRQQGGSRFANFSVNVTQAVEAVAEMLEKIQESEMLFVQWQQ